MIVEIVGSTGVGKSTVARRLLELLQARGIPADLLADGWAWSSDEAARRYHGLPLNWLRWPLAISLAVDVLACPWFLRFLLQRSALSWFMAAIVWRDVESLGLKLNALRNIAKHLGARELLGRRMSDESRIVITDEGAVHQAHNLFVHPGRRPRLSEIQRFTAEIPLPDLLLLVEGPTAAVVQRTIRRNQMRIRGNARQAEGYVTQAQQVFRIVCRFAALRTDTAVVRNFADAQSLDAALEVVLGKVTVCKDKQAYSRQGRRLAGPFAPRPPSETEGIAAVSGGGLHEVGSKRTLPS